MKKNYLSFYQKIMLVAEWISDYISHEYGCMIEDLYVEDYGINWGDKVPYIDIDGVRYYASDINLLEPNEIMYLYNTIRGEHLTIRELKNTKLYYDGSDLIEEK